jgi:hypothetical protein
MFPYLLPPLIIPAPPPKRPIRGQPAPKVLPYFPAAPTPQVKREVYPRTPFKVEDQENRVDEITLSSPVNKRQRSPRLSGVLVSAKVAQIEHNLQKRQSSGKVN